jgi:hypothetical protein
MCYVESRKAAKEFEYGNGLTLFVRNKFSLQSLFFEFGSSAPSPRLQLSVFY